MTINNTEAPAIQILRHWGEMSHYTHVKTATQLQKIVAGLKEPEIAFDTETTGVDVITAKCLGYSFSEKAHHAYWVPIEADPQLKGLLAAIKGKRLIAFNAGYDLAIVEHHTGRKLTNKVVDVMIACFLRDVLGYKHNQGLKPQAKLILGSPTVELKDIIKANLGLERLPDDKVDFTVLEPWQQCIYGCQDSDITLQLWQHPEIQEAVAATPVIWQLEHKLIRVLMDMYERGIGFDAKRCAELDQVLEETCTACNNEAVEMAIDSGVAWRQESNGAIAWEHDELQRLAGKKGLNLASFKQKQLLLFEALELPPTRKCDSGWSTDQEALEIIEGEHEIVSLLMRYAKMVSRRNMYTKKLPTLINPVTGRIHPSLWATGVVSGRFSCTNPPMQGISKDLAPDDPAHIREVFVAPKGRTIICADYSQIELRIAASLSQEPTWCKAYHGNIDVHADTAKGIYAVKKPTDQQRSVAKTANFSILTGISAYTLHARNRKIIASVDEAQHIIDRWFHSLPRLTEWIDEVQREAWRTKQMTTFWGRVRPFPDIRDADEATIARVISAMRERPWAEGKSNAQLRDSAIKSITNGDKRKALSHRIQGTAADIMKISMINMDNAIRKSKLDIKMLLTVHDELLFEVGNRDVNKAKALIKEVLTIEQVDDGWVPLTVNVGTGHSWAEAK